MLLSKIVLPLLAVTSVLTTSTAFANPFGMYRCEEAQQNLNAAQNGYNQAVLILSQVGSICGGSVACIYTAQVAYNNAVTNLQQAQSRVNIECQPGGGHLPPPPPPPPPGGGGWGQPRPFPPPGGGWGHPRPFPPPGGGWGRPRPFPGPHFPR